MAFLQPDILPAMAEAIHRQLRVARGGRLNEDALAALVVPPGLAKGPGGEKMFSDTLRELLGIGALVEAGDEVRLPHDHGGAREPGAMRRLVRERAMLVEADADLWEKDDAGALVLTGARDLVRALAWFLNLDVQSGPFDFEKTNPKLTELQEQQTGERPIFNVERWRPFVRWARYLGFLTDMTLYTGSGASLAAVVPDPTRAILAVLPDSVVGNDWTPMSTVLATLAAELPVLDGGVYRRAVHDKGAPAPKTGCSPSTTLAFKRLSASGVIELDVGAGDAQKVTFANNQGAFHAVRLVNTSHD